MSYAYNAPSAHRDDNNNNDGALEGLFDSIASAVNSMVGVASKASSAIDSGAKIANAVGSQIPRAQGTSASTFRAPAQSSFRAPVTSPLAPAQRRAFARIADDAPRALPVQARASRAVPLAIGAVAVAALGGGAWWFFTRKEARRAAHR
jgi:hypothetical protein